METPHYTQIFLGRAGSHSYGTNTASSDEDFRGIFVADPKYIRTPFFQIHHLKDPNAMDSESYELNKFLSLYCDGNPNILELLFIAEEDVIEDTPEYRLLRQHRSELLSSKVAFTFSGYAIAQLKQMKNQSNWNNNPKPVQAPRQIDYVNLVHNFTDAKIFRVNLEDYYEDHRLVHYGGEIYGLYPCEGFHPFSKATEKYLLNTNAESFEYTDETGKRVLPKFILKYNKMEYDRVNDEWNNYWSWKKLKDRKAALYDIIGAEQEIRNRAGITISSKNYYKIDSVVERSEEAVLALLPSLSDQNLADLRHLCKRHNDFSTHHVDYKHAMHLVRLIRMCEEVLSTGQINVKRHDAAELLAIRNGAWPYEELIKYAQEKDKYIREQLYTTTKLPKQPNRELAAKLIMQVQDMVWGKK